MSINVRYAEALDNDEPITIDGFTLYPILLRDYRVFEMAKSSILIRQSSLPGEYAIMNYLGALYAMDYDIVKKTGQSGGFISNILMMLALSMRYPADALLKQTKIITSESNERELISIDIRAGDMWLHLNPATFNKLRPILAAQNGLELPDEAENVDLVEAEQDIAAQSQANIKMDLRTVIASVARDQRCRRSDLMEYTIREFMELKDAIEREKYFTLYKQAELAGTVKFKDGNPVPSWCYDRERKTNSMISMTEFMSGPGSVASSK